MSTRLFIVLVFCWSMLAQAQEFDPNFGNFSTTHQGYNFNVYSFRMGGTVRAEYFAMNAKNRYEAWYSDKKVMLSCAGAFSETWEVSSKPIGLTIEDGIVKNRTIDPEMDALIMVSDGLIFAMDLDELAGGFVLDDGSVIEISPRTNYDDRMMLIEAAQEEGLTIFQSQLVYSDKRYDNFSNLYYGDQRERRFLATGFYDNNYYNIIVNAPDKLELNVSAFFAKQVLENIGFEVQYIINLDTGGKDILLVRESWENLTYKSDERLDKATNLIVFYTYD